MTGNADPGAAEALHPLARQEALVISELADELLVYDLRCHRAHCLNATAAAIWRGCDGQHSITQLAALADPSAGSPIGVDAVWLALRQLVNAKLLAGPVCLPVDAPRYTRQVLLRRAGLAGAAVLVPAVLSMVAPPAVYAGSCIPAGGACDAPLPGQVVALPPPATLIPRSVYDAARGARGPGAGRVLAGGAAAAADHGGRA